MAGEWFCKIAGSERGPLSPAQLKLLASHGELRREDLVRQGAGGQWIPADRVKGLFSGSAPKHPLPVAKPLDEERPGKYPASGPKPPPIQNGLRGQPKFELVVGSHDAPTLPSIQVSPAVRAVSKPRRSLRLHIAATVALAGVAIALAVIGYAMWRQETPAEQPSGGPLPQVAATPQKPQPAEPKQSAPAPVAKPKPTAEVKWHNAATETLELRGDQISVKVDSARVAGLNARYAVRDATRKFLIVAVNLHNHGTTKKLDFETWGKSTQSSAGVTLGDEHGNHYKLIRVPGEQSPSIYPGKDYTDELVFEPPIDSAKTLHLVLPAAAFGGKGSLNFAIPRTMITVESEPAKPAMDVAKSPKPDEISHPLPIDLGQPVEARPQKKGSPDVGKPAPPSGKQTEPAPGK